MPSCLPAVRFAPRVAVKLALICALVMQFAPLAYAQSADFQQSVEQVRVWNSPNRTRVVFDVNADVQHTMFTLQNPLRLVVDIENTQLSKTLPELDENNPHIKSIRTGQPAPNQLRFVFDLKAPLATNSFVLSPNELYGHRLVVDLEEPVAVVAARNTEQNPRSNDSSPGSRPPTVSPSAIPAPENVITSAPALENRPLVVAVDAGHGGEDPGALGHRGSREKKITLGIARKLVAKIKSNPEMQAFLVREGDYYIKLDERRNLARAGNADMFISLHADAFTKQSASGLSVFALSQRGATSAMASALAAKENASDLIGGVSLADKDEVLAKVLVDLSMTNTISESVNFGGRVLRELAKVGKLHSKKVEQANFAVLRSADIPSILVETGFITNPQEEKRLRTDRYQQQIANAVYTAIESYQAQAPFRTNRQYAAATPNQVSGAIKPKVYQSLVKPPKPSYHQVRRGDSLSKIAQRYGYSVAQIKRANNLKSDTVIVGQRLRLPGGNSGSTHVASSRATPSSTSSAARVHTVKRGESLSLISAKYNVKISSLKRLNNLRKNTVYVGQQIKIPGSNSGSAKAAAPRSPRYHVVKRGDTLSEIAETYGSTMRTIMRANAMRNRTVRLGQTLKIP